MTAGEQVEALCRGLAGKMAARGSYAVTAHSTRQTSVNKRRDLLVSGTTPATI